MRKKLLYLGIILLHAIQTWGATVKVYTSDGVYYNLNTTTLTASVTTGSKFAAGAIVIYDAITYEGVSYTVTSIEEQAFLSSSVLTSVTITDNVTSIGESAFHNCSALESVTLGAGVTSIGGTCFYSCTKLASVTGGSNVTSIGDKAFWRCSALETVEISNALETIGEMAFAECTSLTSVTIPATVTSIGNMAFYNCSGLTDVYALRTEPSEYNPVKLNAITMATFTSASTSTCVLHVPQFCAEVYGKTSPWSSFKNLVADQPNDARIVLDETSTTAPEAATNVDVCVRRAINAEEWSTIVLPFAMTEEQVKSVFGDDVQLADFTGYEVEKDGSDIVGIQINFERVSKMAANHPYLIKVSSDMSEFTLDNVDIEPESTLVNAVAQGSEMVGVYAPTTVPQTALFLSGNQFWYSAGLTQMKGYRAYFKFKDVLTDVEDAYSSKIRFAFGEETTGVGNSVANHEKGAEGVYTLQGVALGVKDVKRLPKGVYIVNGKKVSVK